MIKTLVHVLTTYNSPNSLALRYPLLINRPFFNRHGIKISFYDRLSNKLYNCDVLFINSKFFKAWHGEKSEELYNTLTDFKAKIQKVIWFDTTDSTGTTQFNVMPYVDAYYKAQLLKDRNLYKTIFYGHRIYAEYYANREGIRDMEIDSSVSVNTPLKEEDIHKLRLSWNSGMYNWGGYITRMKNHLPFRAGYTVPFVKANKNRKIDINSRIASSYSRNTTRCQRQRTIDILKERFNVDTTKVSLKQYLNELKNSKIAVSPFGWGEICYRDFEIIINGALLFKADMSHLETWPPLYVDNETYVPYSWDLTDFEEKLRNLLSDEKRIAEISKKAQELYAYYLYGDGRSEFCNKVLDIINERGRPIRKNIGETSEVSPLAEGSR
jgi:hypothetical protein